MALAIHMTGFDADGITVIPPTRPDFDDLAGPLIGRVADIGLKLKPMLVVVSNESAQTVVSFSKLWTIRYPDGHIHTTRSHTSFPDVICGDAVVGRDVHEFVPGTKRVEAANLVIQGYGDTDPYYDRFLDQFVVKQERMLAHAEELQLELPAVIFADGTLIGDDSWLTDLFSEYLSEKQAWYRSILTGLDAGMSVDEAYAPLRTFQEERRERMRTRPLFGADAQLWKTEAAAEAMRWRRKVDDAALPALLRKSIRLDPFVIRPRAG